MKEVIEIIQGMDEAQQIRIGRECFLEPTDQQLVKILTEYPVSRLSKLMREVAFVPRNDDCVNILSNMEPGSRNAVMARDVNRKIERKKLSNLKKLARFPYEKLLKLKLKGVILSKW